MASAVLSSETATDPAGLRVHRPTLTVEALLDRLVSLPTTCPRVSIVAQLMDVDEQEIETLARSACGRDLLALWDFGPGGPRLTLSPLAASRLGVRIDESARYSSKGVNRSCYLGAWTKQPEAPLKVKHQVVGENDEDPADVLDAIPDPRQPPPWVEAAIAERAERVLPPHVEDLGGGTWGREWGAAVYSYRIDAERLWPRHLLGFDLQWPVIFDPKTELCPSCGGRKLSLFEVCGICWRAGVDALLGIRKRPKPEAPERVKSRTKPARKTLRGGVGGKR